MPGKLSTGQCKYCGAELNSPREFCDYICKQDFYDEYADQVMHRRHEGEMTFERIKRS